MITRSIAFSLKESNAGKLELLDQLWTEYQQVANRFLDYIQDGKELTEGYLKGFDSVSYRYKQCAKRQAYKIYKAWYKKEQGESKESQAR